MRVNRRIILLLRIRKMSINQILRLISGISLLFVIVAPVEAAHRTVDLTIANQTVNFTRKLGQAIAVNHQIPAPTLHFKEGDQVTIRVYNQLPVGTTIHWHGLLVPWQMDGVEGISQQAIPPNGVFSYQFTLHQSGTYWYHAHTEFQEQQGLYGGIIIDPIHPPPYRYEKDFVVVLSDWSNTPPEKIYANLKKEGDYYASRFPLQPSLIKFIHDYRHATPIQRKQLIHDYQMMQQMRMNIYDISDVAYDAFLLNGRTPKKPWTAPVSVGDVVRLRFINAAGSTIFNVKIPQAKMKIVQLDGNNIKPDMVKYFTIAPGETYDVLVSITQPEPAIIYAESLDTLGYAAGALTTQPHQIVNSQAIQPFPEPSPVMLEHNMTMDMEKPDTNHTHHSSQMMPMNALPVLTTGTTYQHLIAATKTNDPNKPIEAIIHMDLSGYMDRYIWFINGVPEYKAKPILIKPNKRYRIIFTNNSMMHHPMHIHGHWFILRNGHGAYDPLLHTIDVPPGATVVADIDTNASGQWFFHCHQLYHMVAGMARVFRYTTLTDIAAGKAKPENTVHQLPYANQAIVQIDRQPIHPTLVTHPSAHPTGLYLANFLDANIDPFSNHQEITYKGLFGGDYHKLEVYTNDAEINKGVIEQADLDIFYWHLISQFWAIKGGANYVYRPAKTPYLQPGAGIEGLMPYFIDTNLRTYYHSGCAKLDLELSRDTQITHYFFIRAGIRSILASKTISHDEVGSGLNELQETLRPYYQLNSFTSVYLQYQHTSNYGTTQRLLRQNNEPTNENNYSLGVSLLF